MTEERLLQDDLDARAAALDVSRSFIVQAPAGSGKTELLIQRYLKLLGTVENPEEILAITFTRKAAAEMQLRVLQALKKAGRGEVPDEMHEQVTAEAARAVLRRDEEHDWKLTENPRRMRIQTLDSLNASIARTQPITSTSGGAGNSITADAAMQLLYRDAAAATLDQLAESGDMSEATREVLLHLDNNTWLYVGYLARMLATRDQWLPFVGSGLLDSQDAIELRQSFELNLQNVITQHLIRASGAVPTSMVNELIRLAAYAGENLANSNDPDSPIVSLAEINALPGETTNGLQQWQGIVELLQTKQGQWRKRVTKNQGFPPGDGGQKDALCEMLDELQEHEECRRLLDEIRTLPPQAYSDDQWSVLLALFRLLPLAVTELKRLFAEHSVTDHIEVALSASAALGSAEEPGDVALLLDYQVRHLLVDEMQDTSSAQYRMLEALTGGWQNGDGRTLYCVGDPMQSIYRFRNAEVGQFLLAKSAGIGDVELEPLTLRRNFRSGEKLVDWFNAVFPKVLPGRDDPQRSAVTYSAAVAVPKFAGLGQCVVHPLLSSDAETEAGTGLRIIREVLAEYPDDDMAVLVRSRTHLPALLRRLRQNGIAYRAVEIDRLTDLPEVIDILALTRALAHEGDRLAWLAVLRSPWIGLDWSDLHGLVLNDATSTIWELLHDEAATGRLSGFGQTAVAGLRQVLAGAMDSGRVESLRNRVEKTWLRLGGPAILSDPLEVENVYRYLDVVSKIEVAGSLPDVAEFEDALDREHVSSDIDARLQVMTMHRAKGLQFEHVLLAGLGRAPRSRESTVLSWVDLPDEHATGQKIISPVGPRADIEKDPVHSYIGKVQSEKDKNELGRLLYVACTRAKKTLHLLGNARVLQSGLRPDPRSLLHLLWPSVWQQFEDVYDPTEHDEIEIGGDGWLMPELKRLEPPFMSPEPPPLPVQREMAGAVDSEPKVEFYWVGEGARLAGTLVHRWLQLAAEGRVDLLSISPAKLRETNDRWLRKSGIDADDLAPIAARVDEALQNLLADDRGKWLLEGSGYAELELSGICKGKLESVVLDRVRIDEDGTHWIVDYKTSSHEGGDLANFLAAETDRYRPQLSKYAELYRNYSGADVRCALYFPLLREFIEVRL